MAFTLPCLSQQIVSSHHDETLQSLLRLSLFRPAAVCFSKLSKKPDGGTVVPWTCLLPQRIISLRIGNKSAPLDVRRYSCRTGFCWYGLFSSRPASSRRLRRSARILDGIPSGACISSPYKRFPRNNRSRTTSNVHLSPIRSRVFAMGHVDRPRQSVAEFLLHFFISG